MVGSEETGLSELDEALKRLRIDMDDTKNQSKFYDIFLNTTFCVPTMNQQEVEVATPIEEGQVLPLVMESEGNDYLMLFDSEERLKNWAEDDAKWVGVPGFVLAATAVPPLRWALNVGSEYSKEFLPDEIAWLREVVEQCNEAAKEQKEPLS